MKPFKTEKIDIYKNIKEHSLKDGIPVVKETTGKLLFTFALIELPQRILEIGTGYGYTALILSETLHKNGIIDSIELKEKNFLTAKKNIEKMNKSKEIHLIFGDANEVLPTLTNKYDLIFIDGAKGQYPVYLKHAKSLINENGIIIADNILGGGITNHGDGSHGSGKMNHENRPRGLHGVSRRDMTIVKRMKEYIDDIMSDEEYITSIFDIDDGIIVSKKR